MANESTKYIAFISYSRKDKDVADWLHSKLENYKLADMDSARQIFPFESRYFRPVFLDTQDLHVEIRPFTERLKLSLENSAYLIVLCSKDSAISPFVEMEIQYFLETHDNNLSLIVPLFIDEVKGSVPPCFDGTTIMTRHFPIYNARLSKTSEANNYCFYQIISYILGKDFSEIYNRYEVSAEKSRQRKRKIFSGIIAILSLFLITTGWLFYEYRSSSIRELDRKQRLIDFEKKVFPAAVVHGYERNYLTPVINYLKTRPEKFKIMILMPKNERDLEHQDRVGDFVYDVKMTLGIDSIPFELLPTNTKRGSRIMRVAKGGKIIEGLYMDFATTTTSFIEIANYKKKNEEYDHTPVDSIIDGYSKEFVRQTRERLKSDSVYIEFYYNKTDLIKEIKKYCD